jgi:hypothetical protein
MVDQTPNSDLSVSTIKRAFGPLRNPRTAKQAYIPHQRCALAQAFNEDPRRTSMDRTSNGSTEGTVFLLKSDKLLIFIHALLDEIRLHARRN